MDIRGPRAPTLPAAASSAPPPSPEAPEAPEADFAFNFSLLRAQLEVVALGRAPTPSPAPCPARSAQRGSSGRGRGARARPSARGAHPGCSPCAALPDPADPQAAQRTRLPGLAPPARTCQRRRGPRARPPRRPHPHRPRKGCTLQGFTRSASVFHAPNFPRGAYKRHPRPRVPYPPGRELQEHPAPSPSSEILGRHQPQLRARHPPQEPHALQTLLHTPKGVAEVPTFKGPAPPFAAHPPLAETGGESPLAPRFQRLHTQRASRGLPCSPHPAPELRYLHCRLAG